MGGWHARRYGGAVRPTATDFVQRAAIGVRGRRVSGLGDGVRSGRRRQARREVRVRRVARRSRGRGRGRRRRAGGQWRRLPRVRRRGRSGGRRGQRRRRTIRRAAVLSLLGVGEGVGVGVGVRLGVRLRGGVAVPTSHASDMTTGGGCGLRRRQRRQRGRRGGGRGGRVGHTVAASVPVSAAGTEVRVCGMRSSMRPRRSGHGSRQHGEGAAAVNRAAVTGKLLELLTDGKPAAA